MPQKVKVGSMDRRTSARVAQGDQELRLAQSLSLDFPAHLPVACHKQVSLPGFASLFHRGISVHKTMWRVVSKRCRRDFFVEELQVLSDKVEINKADVGIGELLGDRPPHLTRRPDVHPVY
jgi:hypothetical protein